MLWLKPPFWSNWIVELFHDESLSTRISTYLSLCTECTERQVIRKHYGRREVKTVDFMRCGYSISPRNVHFSPPGILQRTQSC